MHALQKNSYLLVREIHNSAEGCWIVVRCWAVEHCQPKPIIGILVHVHGLHIFQSWNVYRISCCHTQKAFNRCKKLVLGANPARFVDIREQHVHELSRQRARQEEASSQWERFVKTRPRDLDCWAETEKLERQKNNTQHSTLCCCFGYRGLISFIFVPKNRLPTKISTAMNDSAELMLDSPVDGSIKDILEDAILPIGEFLILHCAICPPRLYNTRNLPSLCNQSLYINIGLSCILLIGRETLSSFFLMT